MEETKDIFLWKIAQRRVQFKRHLVSYIIVNGFLWALWFITGGRINQTEDILSAWPIWCTLGWGVGLAFSYVHAYHESGSKDAIQREYDRLASGRK